MDPGIDTFNTAEMTLTRMRMMKMKWYIIAAIVLLSAILGGAGAAADVVAPIGGDMGTDRIHRNVEGQECSLTECSKATFQVVVPMSPSMSPGPRTSPIPWKRRATIPIPARSLGFRQKIRSSTSTQPCPLSLRLKLEPFISWYPLSSLPSL